MLVYENKTPDMTLAKFNNHEHQTYQTHKLKALQKLRNLQYV